MQQGNARRCAIMQEDPSSDEGCNNRDCDTCDNPLHLTQSPLLTLRDWLLLVVLMILLILLILELELELELY